MFKIGANFSAEARDLVEWKIEQKKSVKKTNYVQPTIRKID